MTCFNAGSSCQGSFISDSLWISRRTVAHKSRKNAINIMKIDGMKTGWILVVLVILSAAVARGQVAQSQEPASSGTRAASSVLPPAASMPASDPQFQSRDNRYEIEPGDSFDITFDLTPEFNQPGVAVQPDGFVTLRGIGDIKVEGQTVPQLTNTLRQAYDKILHDPIMWVVLRDFQKPYFIANGQVAHPGKYDLRANTTLIEAIAIAGGFTEASKHSDVQLYRRVSNGWAFAQVINVKKMESKGILTEDPYLHPGDMLLVPKNRFSKIRPFIPNPGVGVNAYGGIP
jgi:polysaccharide biosynthesis/export protein